MSRENLDSRLPPPDSRAFRWWLLPPLILVASMLVASGIVLSRAGEAVADCSGALSSDYECHRERYENLVRTSDVGTAFDELKVEYKESEFVRSVCHGLTHAIGQAAAERYGDISSAYGHGVHFCGTGYYHGVMESVTARVGADKVLEEADTLCDDLGEHRKYSVYHQGCAHGLGHGFMGVLENDLFESLSACDVLTEGWEREHCYNGVFMENYDPSHPSKYLRADLPMYPCTDVEDRYKTQCYQKQTTYALWTQDHDFAKVFELCSEVEEGFRPACYHGLGRNAFEQSVRKNISDTAQATSANMLCMIGEDYEARSNCVAGAVRYFVLYYRDDAQARELCGVLEEGDLRSPCLRAVEEYRWDPALD